MAEEKIVDPTTLISPEQPKADSDTETVELPDLSSRRTIKVTPEGAEARKQAFSLPSEIKTDVRLEDYQKYTGDMINPFTQDIRRMRAEGQGGLRQFGNAVVQTAVGELVGGTIETTGNLLNIFNTEQAIRQTEDTFGGILAAFGSSIREQTREQFPVYTTTEGGFNPSEWSWWMANAPSIASTFAIALPTGLAVKGGGLALKALGAGAGRALRGAKGSQRAKKVDEFLENISKYDPVKQKIAQASGTVAHAGLARYSDGILEASQTYKEKFDEYVAEGFSEQRANELASKAASMVYTWSYANFVSDLYQYGLFRGLARGGGALTKSAKTAMILPAALGEAGEEAYLYGLSQEASYRSDVEAGLVKPHSFKERLGESMDGDMATAAFFGALGSGVMELSAGVYGRATGMDITQDHNAPGSEQTAHRPDQPQPEGDAPEGIDDGGFDPKTVSKKFDLNSLFANAFSSVDQNDVRFEGVVGEAIIPFAVDSASNGNQDVNRKLVDAILDADADGLSQILGEDKAAEPFPDDIKTTVRSIFETGVEEYKQAMKYGKYATRIAEDRTRAKLYDELKRKRKTQYEEAIANYPEIDELSKTGREIFNKRVERDANKAAIRDLKRVLKDRGEPVEEFVTQTTEKLAKEIKRIEGILDKKSKLERKSDEKASDDNILASYRDRKKDFVPYKAMEISHREFAQYKRNRVHELIKQADKDRTKTVDDPRPKTPKEVAEDEQKPDYIPQSGVPVHGDKVKSISSGDEVFTLIDVDGQYYLRDSEGNNDPISDSEIKNWTKVTTKESKSRENSLDEGKRDEEIPDSVPYDRKKSRKGLKADEGNKKKKTTIITGAWNSENNTDPEFKNENQTPLEKVEAQARTKFFENGAPIQQGTFGRVRIDERFPQGDIDPNSIPFSEITDSTHVDAGLILDTPLIMDLYDADGNAITVDVADANDFQVNLPLHNSTFVGRTQENKTVARQRLFNMKRTLLEGIADGREMTISIVNKGTGQITWADDRTKSNVYELLESAPDQQIPSDEVSLAILMPNMTYMDGTRTPKGFTRTKASQNPDQVGRVYTAIKDASGKDFPLPLERATLTDHEAEIVTDLFNDMIGKPNPNAVISQAIQHKIKSDERTAPILEMNSEPSYLDVLNTLVYEGPKSLDTSAPLFLDFNKKVLHIGEQVIPYDEIARRQAEIHGLLKEVPHNVQRKKLNDRAYNDYLINNRILYANLPVGEPILVNPVIYLGEVHELTTTQVEAETETAPTVDPKAPDRTPPNQDLSQDKQDRIKKFRERADKIRKDDSGKIMQRASLAKGVAQDLVPILDNLSLRTGWNYEIVNDKKLPWSGKVEGKTIFINEAFATPNTAYHEFAHPVIRDIKRTNPGLYTSLATQLLSDSEGKVVYQSVKDMNPTYSSEQLLEETIVQLLGDLASENIKSSTLANTIRRIWNMILSYLQKFVPKVNLARLSPNTTLNELAGILRSNSFIGLMNEPMWGYQMSDRFGHKAFESWVNTLTSALLLRQNVTGMDDLGNIDLKQLVESTQQARDNDTYDSIIDLIASTPDINQDQADYVFLSLTNEDGSLNTDSPLVGAIKQKLRSFNITEAKDKTDIDEDSTEVPGDDKTKLFNKKSHYEVDSKLKVSTDIRMLMSFIPQINSLETGGKVKDSPYTRDYVLDNQTGLPKFHSFSDMWNTSLDILTDVVETPITDSEQKGVQDLFDKMVGKLSEIVTERPEFQILIDRLHSKVEADPSVKSRFVRSLYKTKNNFLVNDADRKGNWKIYQKNPQSHEFYVLEQWKSNVINKFVRADKGENHIDGKALNRIKKINNRFGEKVDLALRDGLVHPETIDATLKTLEEFGVEMRDRELNRFLNTIKDTPLESLNYLRGKIHYWIKSLETLSESPVEYGSNWFTQDEQSVMELAESKAFFNRDISDNNILGPENKPYYNYSEHTMMSKRLAELRENPEYLTTLRTNPFYEHSLWADHIQQGNNLTLHNYINQKTYKDKGVRPKNLPLGDRIAGYVNMTLNGFFPMHARGSNSTEYVISGIDPIAGFSIVDNKIQPSKKAIDTFMDYVYDEHNRVLHEQKYLEEQAKLPEDQRKYVDGYHTSVKRSDGSEYVPATQIHILPELMEDKWLFDEDGKAVPHTYDKLISRTDLRNKVSKHIVGQMHQAVAVFDRNGIITHDGTNNGIDKDLFNKYKQKTDRKLTVAARNKLATHMIAYDYVVNSMIANKEQQKIFSGDPAIYSSQENLQKRIIAAGSEGYSMYLDNVPENYTSAMVGDVVIGSKEAEYFEKMGIEGYDSDINVADAQAFVTMEFFIEAMTAWGKTNPQWHSIVEQLQNPNLSADQFASLVREINQSDFTMQPIKNVHAELHFNPQDGLPPRFIYDKQTMLPLHPQMIEGTNLENLYEAMVTQNVDHVSVQSGVKTGGIIGSANDQISPTPIADEDGNILPADQIKFIPYTQSRRFTFLQQDLPNKGLNGVLEGSQVKYNIMADVDPDATYGKYKGADLVKLVHGVNTRLSNIEVEALRAEMATETGAYNVNKANKKIIEQSTKRQVDNNLITGLEQGYLPEALVSHNIPIQNMMASLTNDAGMRTVHTAGGAMIQVSNLGFTNQFESLSGEVKRGITWLTDKKDLTPPKYVDGKLHPGSILLPHSALQKYPRLLNHPESAREILSGIDFRIPNQQKSNIGFFEIAGILPPKAGDSAVVYGEITKKTGSDFDVDKIQVMMYNLHPDKMQKVEYHDIEATKKNLDKVYEDRLQVEGDLKMTKQEFIDKYEGSHPLEFNGKLAIENYKLDLYTALLSNEDAYKDMMKVLEDPLIENLIKGSDNYHSADPRRRLNPLNGIYQAITREIYVDANSGVGVIANHIIDHVKSQRANQVFRDDKGKPINFKTGNTYKVRYNGKEHTVSRLSDPSDKKISNYLSMLMNAMVDAEKDPYVAMGNVNLYTISPAVTAIRFGIKPELITKLLDSNAIRQYIANKRFVQSSFNTQSTKIIEKTLEQLEIDPESYYKQGIVANPQSDVQMLKFYTTLENVSSDVSKGIRGSKFTADGMGKDIFDNIVLEESYYQARRLILGFDDKFYFDDGTPTMEKTYFDNTIEFFKETFGENLIANTPQFRGYRDAEGGYSEGLIHTIAEMQNLDLTDRNTIQQIYRGVYSYVMSEPFKADINDLIGKENSVAKQLAEFKKKHSFMLTDLLQPVFRGDYDFLAFPNSMKFGESETNTLYDDWLQIHRIDPAFSMRLAQYAYASSGFNFGINSFFQYMPVQVMNEFGVKEHMEQVLNDLSVISDESNTNLKDGINQIIRNNWRSPLVPEAFNSKRRKDVAFLDGNRRIELISDKKRFEEPPKYLKFNENLYTLVDSDNNIYDITSKLGMYDKGFKIVEYDKSSYDPESFFAKGTTASKQEAHKIVKPQSAEVKDNVNPKETGNQGEKSSAPVAQQVEQMFLEQGRKDDIAKVIGMLPKYDSLEDYVASFPNKTAEEIKDMLDNFLNCIG